VEASRIDPGTKVHRLRLNYEGLASSWCLCAKTRTYSIVQNRFETHAGSMGLFLQETFNIGIQRHRGSHEGIVTAEIADVKMPSSQEGTESSLENQLSSSVSRGGSRNLLGFT
jgi:hypothetical protein